LQVHDGLVPATIDDVIAADRRPAGRRRVTRGTPHVTSYDKFKSEMVAGGSVEERPTTSSPEAWRGALGVSRARRAAGLARVVNIWWFVFVVGVLIAVFLHELGHFVTARWTGMKATQFFIGFGPRLWSFRRGETEYGVRALPLGAFVRIIGMNNMDDVEPADEPRTYRSRATRAGCW
jgi:hypothetical protein